MKPKKAIKRVNRIVDGAFNTYLAAGSASAWKDFRALEMALEALKEKEEQR